MVFTAEGFDGQLVEDLLFALPAAGGGAFCVARHAIGVIVALDERGGAVEGVATLGAEEVADVPFGAGGDNDLALDGGLAGAAAWREKLVEIEVAVEAKWVIDRLGGIGGDAHVLEADEAFLFGLRVERDAF